MRQRLQICCWKLVLIHIQHSVVCVCNKLCGCSSVLRVREEKCSHLNQPALPECWGNLQYNHKDICFSNGLCGEKCANIVYEIVQRQLFLHLVHLNAGVSSWKTGCCIILAPSNSCLHSIPGKADSCPSLDINHQSMTLSFSYSFSSDIVFNNLFVAKVFCLVLNFSAFTCIKFQLFL